MSIINLDGELNFNPYNRTTSTVCIKHKTRENRIPLGPQTFSQKWKVPSSGYYTPTDVRLAITPHISEKAGVMAKLALIDESDLGPSRVLYQSPSFNLGKGIVLEGSQLPFCLPVGEYPILFEVTVSRSQFQEHRTMFSTSLEWRMMWSNTPLSRVNSVFALAHENVDQVDPNLRRIEIGDSLSRGPRVPAIACNETSEPTADGGTTGGLVSPGCVGSDGTIVVPVVGSSGSIVYKKQGYPGRGL